MTPLSRRDNGWSRTFALRTDPRPSTRSPAGGFALHGSIVLLVLIWGTTWAAIRIGLQGVPPFTGVAIRFAVGSLLLFAALPLFRIKLGRNPNERRVWIANGLLLFTISYGTVYWGEQWIPSGLAAVLFATFPLFVAVMAHFLLPGEPLRRAAVIGVLLGFAGIAIIHSEDLNQLGGPNVAGAATIFLLSPFASALANVLVKKWANGIHPLSTTVVPMAIGAAALGCVALAKERALPMRFDVASVGSIAYLALVGTVVTFLLYYRLLSRYPVRKLALIAYATPVVAVLIGTLVLREPITLRMIVGSLVVLIGVTFAVRSR